jgi:hypothetical protein
LESEASEQTKKKVQAAKSYIENMYKVQHQNIKGRTERYVELPLTRRLTPSRAVTRPNRPHLDIPSRKGFHEVSVGLLACFLCT